MPLDARDRARIERDMHRQRRFIPVVLHDFLTYDDMARIAVGGPPTCLAC